MSSVFILDTSFLGNIYDNGSETALKILNYIKSNYDAIILTDQVNVEIEPASFSSVFDEWAANNAVQIVTPAGEYADGQILTNYGEKSIAQIINGEVQLPSDLIGSDITIGIDDMNAFKTVGEVDGELLGWFSNSKQMQDIANGAFEDGALSLSNYLQVADNLDYLNINSDITQWLSPSDAFNLTKFSKSTGITADANGLINILCDDGSTVGISVLDFANIDWGNLLDSGNTFPNTPDLTTEDLLKAAPVLARASELAARAEAIAAGVSVVEELGILVGSIGVVALGIYDLCAAANLYEAYLQGKEGNSAGAMTTLEGFWGHDALETGIGVSDNLKNFLNKIIDRLGLGDGLNGLGLGPDGLGLDLGDGLGKQIGDWIGGIGDKFGRALTDPIVLDLSGRNNGTTRGVELTALADSDAYFDLHNTSFAVHTGWVGADTGILVQDNNSNGSVDNIWPGRY